jgi:glycosyltransferase involved in cell wall biosynthesis
MEIIVKSFNRPFYLERCLKSIFLYLKGDYKIIVLDDGTPERYLNKIKLEFPEVEIRLSSQYASKIKSIQNNLEKGEEINGFEIPTDLWVNAVKEAPSDYVLVTEDDVWLTQEVNLNLILDEMISNQVRFVKLGWLGNKSEEEYSEIQKISKNLERIRPQNLFTANALLMDWFMYNKFKFFTFLYKLGIVDNHTKLKYWSLNSILMGLYEKEYWLYIWKDANGKVDEKQQLRNAAVYYHKQKQNPNFIARTNQEYLKTTFQSSATNSYHGYGYNFDVNYFNHLMNEAWFREEFDVMENFPKDFSMDYFEKFIDKKINKEEFRSWVEKFKKQYRNLGAQVD